MKMKLKSEYKKLLAQDAVFYERDCEHYAAELAAANGNVIIYENDEAGLVRWAIVADNERTRSKPMWDSDWLWAFPTQRGAVSFAKRQGWNVTALLPQNTGD